MDTSSTTRRLHPSRPHPVPVAPGRAAGRLGRAAVRATVRWGLRRIVATAPGLALINRLHRALTPRQKRRFFYLCYDESCRVDGLWVVDFCGRRLLLPLHPDFELAWIAATGFHGYDTEVHELYEMLVRGPEPPRVFFDVGANYGLHSLKLLAHGIRVVSFEPNVDCHAFFLDACRVNGVRPDIRALAVGRTAGTTRLAFPAGRTYLGTTMPGTVERWGEAVEVITRRVPETTLDELADAEGIVPDLVKIDTEGSELAVLEGAETILERARPLIVLESWRDSEERTAMFRRLAAHGYGLHALRFAARPSAALALGDFLASPATNFLARPGVAAL